MRLAAIPIRGFQARVSELRSPPTVCYFKELPPPYKKGDLPLSKKIDEKPIEIRLV